jgi:hypothetical protein
MLFQICRAQLRINLLGRIKFPSIILCGGGRAGAYKYWRRLEHEQQVFNKNVRPVGRYFTALRMLKYVGHNLALCVLLACVHICRVSLLVYYCVC